LQTVIKNRFDNRNQTFMGQMKLH